MFLLISPLSTTSSLPFCGPIQHRALNNNPSNVITIAPPIQPSVLLFLLSADVCGLVWVCVLHKKPLIFLFIGVSIEAVYTRDGDVQEVTS